MVRFSLTTKLILSFSAVILIAVFLFGIIGIRLIGNTIVKQAHDKVRLDLNSAREVYREEETRIKDIVRLTSNRFFIKNALIRSDRETLITELQKIREAEFLDVLTLVDRHGHVILRAGNPIEYGNKSNNRIVKWVLTHKQIATVTQIVSKEELEVEGDYLAEQSRIELIPTQKARRITEKERTNGMMLTTVAPIFDNEENIIGVLYGGKLLNHNYDIVDKVKDIVYRGETYKGQDVGTVTIFQDDLRISTNVIGTDGKRAIGTRVSKEVYEQVIGKSIPWFGRAFVVNDWYITAYEPIKDISGTNIGMLYVGMLESPYTDLRNRVVLTFLIIALSCVILLSTIAYLSTTNITKPIKALLHATNKVARGNLSHRVKIRSRDEIGQLAESFNHMTRELQNVTKENYELTATLEKKIEEKTEELRKTQDQLIRSEKLTSLGKLAAGIAHEINNPLTAILVNSHLIAEECVDNDKFKEKLDLIIDETARCSSIVKGLLEFARQTPPERKSADINKIIEKTLLLFKSQILVTNVRVEKNLSKILPSLMIDTNKIEQVFTNVILNALDAMPDGGTLTINTEVSADNKSVEVKFKDTGCGISKDNINKIFDPFFSAKRTKGTGLGLSVSYGIIKQHDGTIRVQSEPKKGTTIIICLPINVKRKHK